MQKSPRLLSELPLGTYLRYSPKGGSDVSKNSRRWRDAVKAAKPDWIGHALDRLSERLEASGLSAFLGPEVTLVPVPRSAPLTDPKALWPGRVICEELAARGLGKEVLLCIERTKAIPKSAFARKGERPSAELHFETMRATADLIQPARITLVDDIVTIGQTLVAAGSHVHAACPGAELRAFALIHTYGMVPDVERIDAPYMGVLRRNGNFISHDPPR